VRPADFPLPDTEWEGTRGFWEAAAREQLAIPRCAACARFQWYPRERCPACGGAELPWTPVSGRGTLFSWAVVRRALVPAFAGKVPYVPGLVALVEDPAVRIVTELVDCAPEALRAELPVRVVFRPLEFPGVSRRVLAPMFTPET
jgi:uncharacterized OB-fold protein